MASPSPYKELTIERLAPGGDGMGYVDSVVCFVPFTAPGDRVAVQISKKNRRFLRGRLVEVIESSTNRRDPPCAEFGACGGCQWLHVRYAAQVEAKRGMLAHALGTEAVELVPSPRGLGYRSVARLHSAAGTATSLPVFGFHHVDRRAVVPVGACPVLAPFLGKCLSFLGSELIGHLRGPAAVRLCLGDDGPAALVVSDDPVPETFYRAAEALVPRRLAGVVLAAEGIVSVIAGTGEIRTAGADGRPSIAPVGSFGQANPEINRRIADTIVSWIRERGFDTALELFAGAGNFSVAYARHLGEVTISELDEAACASARRNLASRGLNHVTVLPGDALEVYRRRGAGADLVLLDPPRDGHEALASAMANGDHRAIIYISCNPATLARDLAALRDNGYKCTAAVGFDMFPQTPHMEAAVMMER